MRPEIQATLSTRCGWTAKSAAITRLSGQRAVSRRASTSTSSALTAWSTTFVRWCPPAHESNRLTSSMCETIVSGCQLEQANDVNAAPMPPGVRPERTSGLAVTYKSSSHSRNP